MPPLRRPDGAEIAWRERGEGPAAVLACDFFNSPAAFGGLLDELAADHRVVSFDYRGCGESSPSGPYDPATDGADLGAVIEELGEPAVVLGMGYGCVCGVRLAATRPELVQGVVGWGNPLGRQAVRRSEALIASVPVLDALIEMLENDFRSAVHQMVRNGNPHLDEEGRRKRVDDAVAYAVNEAPATRLRAYVANDSTKACLALGERMCLAYAPGNPWFPADIAEPAQKLLPEARVELLADGPISRPDLTAGLVREMSRKSQPANQRPL